MFAQNENEKMSMKKLQKISTFLKKSRPIRSMIKKVHILFEHD